MIELLGSKCRCRRVLVFLHGLIDTSLIVELVELVGKDGSQSVRRRRWRCGVWSAFLMGKKAQGGTDKKVSLSQQPCRHKRDFSLIQDQALLNHILPKANNAGLY
mmetsp:Transcript_30068/g.56423  ORF Transcript_30068/g.56423 Transcript_30068/m.56423 type:complete len:105 (-) Transcript_30068:108-422(-)